MKNLNGLLNLWFLITEACGGDEDDERGSGRISISS
jgi:hypothetical protein